MLGMGTGEAGRKDEEAEDEKKRRRESRSDMLKERSETNRNISSEEKRITGKGGEKTPKKRFRAEYDMYKNQLLLGISAALLLLEVESFQYSNVCSGFLPGRAVPGMQLRCNPSSRLRQPMPLNMQLPVQKVQPLAEQLVTEEAESRFVKQSGAGKEGGRDTRLLSGMATALFLAGYAFTHHGQMTYLQLHLFLVLPELWMRFARPRPLAWAPQNVRRVGYMSILPLALAAITFSSAWDNFIFSKGVFTFDKGSMLGTIGAMPVEEWIWFVDHTTLASIVTLSMLKPRSPDELTAMVDAEPARRTMADYGMLLGCLATSLGGLSFLLSENEHLLFLGVCMLFFPPVLALQWWFGLGLFLQRPGEWLGAVGLTSCYVIGLDSWALKEGIWHLSEEYVTGGRVLGLEVEQVLIYSLTTLLVVQSVLFGVRVAEGYSFLQERRRSSGDKLRDVLRTLNRSGR
eukprot:756604-Hanusia_phi.AAC.7